MGRILFALAILMGLVGCAGNGAGPNPTQLVFYGLSADGQVVRFPAADVTDITHVPVTGVTVGSLMSIDCRESDGTLHGRASNGQLYQINLATGVATPYGPILRLGAVLRSDFIPGTEFIRYVGESQANLRVSADDGSVITDTTLDWAPGDPRVGASFSIIAVADTGTVVYAMDGLNDYLVRIGTPESPTTGLMHTIAFMGFDISTFGAAFEFADGKLYAAMKSSSAAFSSLYTVNTTTGQRTWAGPILSEFAIISLTSRME